MAALCVVQKVRASLFCTRAVQRLKLKLNEEAIFGWADLQGLGAEFDRAGLRLESMKCPGEKLRALLRCAVRKHGALVHVCVCTCACVCLCVVKRAADLAGMSICLPPVLSRSAVD